MNITIGARLGPYEIVSTLGAGGMGEVYRARDAKLNRDVAIKVLLPAVANDPGRLARFSREAQVLASLNHPNIAAIYGLEESPAEAGRHIGTDVASGFSRTIALVMELVEGEDLSQRIARGAIPIDEALPIARQIAEALETAHEQGIIHRDLKPANIKVRADGTVKVLDFGLAKAMDTAGGAGRAGGAGQDALANSPTLSLHATEAGLILGTAAYMSPEQARGHAVDKRADLWSFGVVLHEMLTGTRLFEGTTISDTLAAVLTKTPDWSTLPATTPSSIRRLLRRCLEKDRKRRIESAADARLEIDDALSSSPAEADATTTALRRSGLPRWAVGLLTIAATAAVAVAGTLAWRGANSAPPSPLYVGLDAPIGFVIGEPSRPTRTPMVFTADGRSLVIQVTRDGKSQLFLKSLDRPEARPIAGTDGAHVPFVSPDGKWVGFTAAGELRKVPVEGGTPTTICPLKAVGPNGAAWGRDDVIVFGEDASGRIMRVPAGGGTPVPVTAPVPRVRRHVSPFVLPNGTHLLFSDVSILDASDARLMVQALAGGDARLVLASATDGRVLPSGQLAFMRLGTLMTVGFDAARAAVTGDAVAALADVMQGGLRSIAGSNNTGAGMFTVSSLGALAAIRGPVTGGEPNLLRWITLDGQSSSAEPASGAPIGARVYSRISPDRSRAIVSVLKARRREMWIADWTRGVWTECAGCSTEGLVAVWSPDGRRLLLGRNAEIVAHSLDGSAPDEVLVHEVDRQLLPTAWLLDGRIVYLSSSDSRLFEIKLLEPGGSAGRVVVPLGLNKDPAVSSDGRWLAYTSTPQTDQNVFVQAFPGPGSRTQVSAGGGYDAVWGADGRTLYYLGPTAKGQAMFAVGLSGAAALTAGTPRELFLVASACDPYPCHDISADGPKFLFRESRDAEIQNVTRMDLVLNWTATLGKGQ